MGNCQGYDEQLLETGRTRVGERSGGLSKEGGLRPAKLEAAENSPVLCFILLTSLLS